MGYQTIRCLPRLVGCLPYDHMQTNTEAHGPTELGGIVARQDLRLPFIIGAGIQLVATLLWSRVILRASEYNEPIPTPRRETMTAE